MLLASDSKQNSEGCWIDRFQTAGWFRQDFCTVPGCTRPVSFEPLDFLAKLAALVPRPRLNTLRFHGVYAPNARLRAQAVAAPKARAPRKPCTCGPGVPSPQTNRLCWSELLRRTFSADVFACPKCGSRLVRIAWITTPDAIRAILRAVGLATDAPAQAPPRSAEDLFGVAA